MLVRILVCLVLMFVAAKCHAADRPNVLFIAIDDLRNDLGALGATHAKTPQLDDFAKTARVFSHHYIQVPTCGASRCALLRGRYPTESVQLSNQGILATHAEWGAQSLPSVFHQNGYRTLALGKVTHYPGGLTGKDWSEGPEELPEVWDRCWIPDSPWKAPEAIMHGYANGVPRQLGKSPPWEAFAGPDDSYPDAWVAMEATKTLQQLATQEQPWFFAVGFFKPHLPFAAPKRWHELHERGVPDLSSMVAARPTWPASWYASGEFRGNYGHAAGRDPETDIEYARQIRQAYAACVSYMDAQVGKVLAALQTSGLDKNTIVIIWSDHGFLLGEHSIWGKHCLYEPALRSPLMIRLPGLVKPGATSAAIVETVDVYPTLTELCKLPTPFRLDGHSLVPQLNDPNVKSTKPASSFWTDGLRSVRTDRWRLIVQPGNNLAAAQIELFDYLTDPHETRNHANMRANIANELLVQIDRIPQPKTLNQPSYSN